VISPLLANVYLHYVLDLWVQAWREKSADGGVILVRYADDFVLGFEHRSEAGRFLEELRERLAKFGLELHPAKTRLIELGRWALAKRRGHGEGKPETFGFLGFTHICEINEKSGRFVVRRGTVPASGCGRSWRRLRASYGHGCRRRRARPASGCGRWCEATFNTTGRGGKPAEAGGFSLDAGPALATGAAASRPETPDKLGPVLPAAGGVCAAATLLSPVSKCALCRYPSEARAV